MTIKTHAIEIEEFLLPEKKKILHSKIVPYAYIYYVPPYINEGVGQIIKSIFDFIDLEAAKSYLTTKFDPETNEVKYYETSHKRRYNEITQDGVDFLFGKICKTEEPELLKSIREENIPSILSNILLTSEGKVVSLSIIIRPQDLLDLREYIELENLETFLNIIAETEILETRCIIKIDLETNDIWVGFIDSVPPKMTMVEIFEDNDWQKKKSQICDLFVENGFMTSNDRDFIMAKTSGRQSITVKFLLKENKISKIHYNNMIVFDFEEITD